MFALVDAVDLPASECAALHDREIPDHAGVGELVHRVLSRRCLLAAEDSNEGWCERRDVTMVKRGGHLRMALGVRLHPLLLRAPRPEGATRSTRAAR